MREIKSEGNRERERREIESAKKDAKKETDRRGIQRGKGGK